MTNEFSHMTPEDRQTAAHLILEMEHNMKEAILFIDLDSLVAGQAITDDTWRDGEFWDASRLAADRALAANNSLIALMETYSDD